PGTVRAEEPGHVAGVDCEGNIVDGGLGAVSLRQAFCFDHGYSLSGCGSCSTLRRAVAWQHLAGVDLWPGAALPPQAEGSSFRMKREHSGSPGRSTDVNVMSRLPRAARLRCGGAAVFPYHEV